MLPWPLNRDLSISRFWIETLVIMPMFMLVACWRICCVRELWPLHRMPFAMLVYIIYCIFSCSKQISHRWFHSTLYTFCHYYFLGKFGRRTFLQWGIGWHSDVRIVMWSGQSAGCFHTNSLLRTMDRSTDQAYGCRSAWRHHWHILMDWQYAPDSRPLIGDNKCMSNQWLLMPIESVARIMLLFNKIIYQIAIHDRELERKRLVFYLLMAYDSQSKLVMFAIHVTLFLFTHTHNGTVCPGWLVNNKQHIIDWNLRRTPKIDVYDFSIRCNGSPWEIHTFAWIINLESILAMELLNYSTRGR